MGCSWLRHEQPMVQKERDTNNSPKVAFKEIVLTVAMLLMYHHSSGILSSFIGNYGRLLKLVDRADLGSVGLKRRESSSLSPPIFRTAPVMREWLSGRASPCQGESRGFDPRLPLQAHL